MFNECLIHLCDCTWLNMLLMLNYMLIKHKKIFERFSCFWKMFLFWNFQKLCNPVLVTCLTGQASHMPQSQAYIEDFHDSLVGQGPSHEKDLENFSKIWVFKFLMTQFGDLFTSGNSSHKVYSECFVAPFATLFSIYSNFCLKVISDLFATHFDCENRMICTMRVFFRTGFKNFSFSPSHLVTIHLLVHLSIFQNHRVHTQTLHILPYFFTNL